MQRGLSCGGDHTSKDGSPSHPFLAPSFFEAPVFGAPLGAPKGTLKESTHTHLEAHPFETRLLGRLWLAAPITLRRFRRFTAAIFGLVFQLSVGAPPCRGEQQAPSSGAPFYTSDLVNPTKDPRTARNKQTKKAIQSIPDSFFLTEPFPETSQPSPSSAEPPPPDFLALLPVPELPASNQTTPPSLFETSSPSFLFEPLFSTTSISSPNPPAESSISPSFDSFQPSTNSEQPNSRTTNPAPPPSPAPFLPSALTLPRNLSPLQDPFPQNSPFENGLEAITRFSDPSASTHRSQGYLYSIQVHSTATYDSNVNLSRSSPTSDLELSLGPVAQLQVGNLDSPLKLHIGYAAFSTRFLKHPNPINLEQRGFLQAIWSTGKSQINLHGGLDTSNTGSRDTGHRDNQSTYFGGISFLYQATEKSSFDLSLDSTHSGYGSLLGSSEIRGQGFLNYLISQKTQLGVGAGMGVLQADRSPSQHYHQGLIRCVTQPREKISLSASGGIEWRNTDDHSDSTTAPVFSLASSWQPTQKTTLSLQAQHRRFASAAAQQQEYVSSSVTISAQTQLTTSIHSALSAGYEHASYSSTGAGSPSTSRNDRFYTARAELRWAFRRWCDLGLFIEQSANASSEALNHSFRRERVGLSISLIF